MILCLTIQGGRSMRRDKRKPKDTNEHVKKYNRIKIFGGAIYLICLVTTFSYWLYIIFLLIWTSFTGIGSIVEFPFINARIGIAVSLLPIISILEYLYERLLQSRATKVLIKKEERRSHK